MEKLTCCEPNCISLTVFRDNKGYLYCKSHGDKLRLAGRKGMRRLKALTDRETNKINFLWFVNQRNITDIAKIVKRSPIVCWRHLFKTQDIYDIWYKSRF